MKNALSVVHGDNTICQQIVREKDIISVGKKVFESGVEVMIAIRVPKASTKAAAIPFLRDLTSIGVNQKTAAFLNGISQSYVSKLFRR